MIERNIEKALVELARYYPVVTVTGPRQAGKTTLCKKVFTDKSYVSCEALDTREYVLTDPRGFLAQYREGAIIDEVQYVPSLLNYLQVEVDDRDDPGRFILTGSQHFGLTQAISQSLAGRTGMLTLLPVSLDELRCFDNYSQDMWEVLHSGGYPRIHDRKIPSYRWLADYVMTYIQRDVREVLNVGDLQVFTTFLKLCAGRTAQEINLSSLAADAGVSTNTIRSWLSVFETSYICFRLPAWHRNLRKQLTKSPKLHFFDTGLICYLLGIPDAGALRHHPLRGAIFESWLASEIYKARVNQGLEPSMYHFRESRGLEIDVVLEASASIILVEAKSGATISNEFMKPFPKMVDLIKNLPEGRVIESRLVYGGDQRQHRSQCDVYSWSDITNLLWN